jgi:hypothetical protein
MERVGEGATGRLRGEVEEREVEPEPRRGREAERVDLARG